MSKLESTNLENSKSKDSGSKNSGDEKFGHNNTKLKKVDTHLDHL